MHPGPHPITIFFLNKEKDRGDGEVKASQNPPLAYLGDTAAGEAVVIVGRSEMAKVQDSPDPRLGERRLA